MFTEIFIAIFLIIINGLLAMSEMAVISARPARLKILRDEGSAGARMALRLAEHPGKFLSTVQVGITLIGVLSGAFSGATLGVRLTGWLRTQGFSEGLADAFGVGFVVMAITYLSLIVGELAPKQIALRAPERIAARVAPIMILLSKISWPLVWLLDGSSKLILGWLGQSGGDKERMTDEEVKAIIVEAESAGVLEREEKEMISGVMRLADRNAKALMTPRGDVEILDINEDFEKIRRQIRQTKRSRLPARDGETDNIIGVVYVRDFLESIAEGRIPDIRALTRQAPVVVDSARALNVLRRLRANSVHMALVFDERGHFEGIITSGDVLEAIAGAFQDEDVEEPAIVRREDGSYLVAGWMPIDEFSDQIGLSIKRDQNFETLAGFVLAKMKRLPNVGEYFEHGLWRFEVVDLDGRRIDKILVSRRLS